MANVRRKCGTSGSCSPRCPGRMYLSAQKSASNFQHSGTAFRRVLQEPLSNVKLQGKTGIRTDELFLGSVDVLEVENRASGSLTQARQVKGQVSKLL